MTLRHLMRGYLPVARQCLPLPRRFCRSCHHIRRKRHLTTQAATNALQSDIETYASKEPYRVSLKSLVDIGIDSNSWLSSMRETHSLQDTMKPLRERMGLLTDTRTVSQERLITYATFLHRELPVRLARGVVQLDAIVGDPVASKHAADLQGVRNAYFLSFQELRQAAVPDNEAQEAEFVRMLEKVQERHADDLLHVARGVYQLRKALHLDRDSMDTEAYQTLHTFLDRLHLKRIGLRILIGHYIKLHEEDQKMCVGIICLKTKLKDIVSMAISDARWMCHERYGFAPEVEIAGGDEVDVPLIPEHCYYIAMELVKNALRAQVEFLAREYADEQKAKSVPPIQVLLAREYSLSDGPQALIEVLDHGGGIPAEDIPLVFCYLFTTSEPEIQAAIVSPEEGMGPPRRAPLAGLGYGLPIARLYACYHGGDLEILNRSDVPGVCARVTLTRLAERKEPVV